MSVIVRNNEGKPILEIGDWVGMKPTVDGKICPYGAHWITRADPPVEGEGFLCPADKLVDLLEKFYSENF